MLNKRLCILLMSIAFFTTSCLDVDTAGGAAQDLTPIIEKQDLFEKKLNQIQKTILVLLFKH